MNDILFTSPEFIRSVTIVSDNLQDKYILSSIREAQDIDFQQVVGSRLYKKLKALVEDESITFEGMAYYRELLDKAQYFIAYQTLANLTVNSTFKINNVGVNTISDENVQSASLSDTFKLSKFYTDKADHYKMMLQKWLLKYKNKFPELQKQDVSELSAEVHSAASCNLFLGGARGKMSNKPCETNTSEGSGQGYDIKPLSVTENGTYKPKDYDCDAFSSVEVNVQLNIPRLKIQNGTTLNLKGDVKLDTLDLSEMTDMHSLFHYATEMTSVDLSGIDTSKVTSMSNMFGNCWNLRALDVTHFNTSNVTDMSGMFNSLYSISELDLTNFDTSNVTSMDAMFKEWHLETIDLSMFNVGKVERFNNMFQYSRTLKSVNLSGWDTKSVKESSTMFDGCNSLESLDLSGWNIGNLTQVFAMFNDCTSLKSLNLSGWDMTNIDSIARFFDGCTSLTDLNLDGAIFPKRDLEISLSRSPLTVDSIVSVLNALPQLSNGESHYIWLGENNINKLSDDQKSIATNKNWTLQ